VIGVLFYSRGPGRVIITKLLYMWDCAAYLVDLGF